jgi:hypothetical protein
MLGVPIDGPTSILSDNESVIKNTSAPESTLKRRSSAINYHHCREAVASGMCRTGWVGTHDNLADIATKSLPGSQRQKLTRQLLW